MAQASEMSAQHFARCPGGAHGGMHQFLCYNRFHHHNVRIFTVFRPRWAAGVDSAAGLKEKDQQYRE
jgi:hypothetical protein